MRASAGSGEGTKKQKLDSPYGLDYNVSCNKMPNGDIFAAAAAAEMKADNRTKEDILHI